jgi:hypothetical protein
MAFPQLHKAMHLNKTGNKERKTKKKREAKRNN